MLATTERKLRHQRPTFHEFSTIFYFFYEKKLPFITRDAESDRSQSEKLRRTEEEKRKREAISKLKIFQVAALSAKLLKGNLRLLTCVRNLVGIY